MTLLSPHSRPDDESDADTVAVRTRQVPLPVISAPFLGVQSVWSLEGAFASPYLVSLGLPKSGMALVFLAAPLSGLVVQPLIGSLADRSRSRFGRRRPFMLVGVLVCVGSMLLLGYTRRFASLFVSGPSSAHDALTIFFAVWAMFGIDFSINGVMAADRALLVDVLPPTDQGHANAWAGRMMGIGNVSGFFIGNINLPKLLPALGSTQLQIISLITSAFLGGTHLLTAYWVSETPHVPKPGARSGQSLASTFIDIYHHSRRLPHVIWMICIAQFFSSLAQFPSLFFTSVYVGDLYKASNHHSQSSALDEEAARAGSRVLFSGAVVGFTCSIVLPWILKRAGSWRTNTGTTTGIHAHASLALLDLWAVGHAVLAVVMLLAAVNKTVTGAMVLFSINGYCLAVNHWAPYTLIGEAILLGNQKEFPHQNEDSNQGLEAERLLSNEPDFNASTLHPSGNISDKAGIILGIYNVFIVLPQFIIIALSALIFAILEPHRSVVPTPGSPKLPAVDISQGRGMSAIGVIFSVGGVGSLVAFYLTMKLSREIRASLR